MKKKKSERIEALMRIPVVIISGMILVLWRSLIYLLVIINFIYILISGRRLKELVEMGEFWNAQWHQFWTYIIFASNDIPFPFGNLRGRTGKFR